MRGWLSASSPDGKLIGFVKSTKKVVPDKCPTTDSDKINIEQMIMELMRQSKKKTKIQPVKNGYQKFRGFALTPRAEVEQQLRFYVEFHLSRDHIRNM